MIVSRQRCQWRPGHDRRIDRTDQSADVNEDPLDLEKKKEKKGPVGGAWFIGPCCQLIGANLSSPINCYNLAST